MPKGDLIRVLVVKTQVWKVRAGPNDYPVSAWEGASKEAAEKLLDEGSSVEVEFEYVPGASRTAKVVKCSAKKVAPPAVARKKEEKEVKPSAAGAAAAASLASPAILPCERLQWECTKCREFDGNFSSGAEALKACLYCSTPKMKPANRSGSWKTADKVERFRKDRWECPDKTQGSKCGDTSNTWLDHESCQKCKAAQPHAKEVAQWISKPGGLWVIPDLPEPPPPSDEAYTVDELCAIADAGCPASAPQKCPCCSKPLHGVGDPVCFSVFYGLKEAGTISKYRTNHRRTQLQTLLNEYGQCTCVFGTQERALLVLPSRGRSDLAFYMSPTDGDHRGQYSRIRADAPPFSSGVADFSAGAAKRDVNMGCHVVPLVAGGCPTTFLTEAHLPGASSTASSGGAASSGAAASVVTGGSDRKERHMAPGNIMPLRHMCPLCQALDVVLTDWQNEHAAVLNSGRPFDENKYMAAHMTGASIDEAE